MMGSANLIASESTGRDENVEPSNLHEDVVRSLRDPGQPVFYEDGYEIGIGQEGHLAQAPRMEDTVPEFPEPRMDTIGRIAASVSDASIFQREAIAHQLMKPDYLDKLLECINTIEDLEDENGRLESFRLIKGAIALNDTSLLELMLSDDNIETVVGALEHDPTIPERARVRHRDNIRGTMSLKEVVPIVDPSARAKILRAYRIGYLKDTILPKSLDDATYATLSSLQLFNIVEVLLILNNDKKFFPDFFEKLEAAEKGSEEWKDLVSFLQELISLSRNLQASQRNGILVRLYSLGLFHVLSEVLSTDDCESKLRAADVLLGSAIHDPSNLRSYIQGSKDGESLFSHLIFCLIHRSTSGLQEQVLELLKILLDPETMDSQEEKDSFIDKFYDSHIWQLMEVVSDAIPSEKLDADGKQPPCSTTLLLIVELLCYCVTQHSYRIKYYILRNNTVEKVLRLFDREEKAVAAAGLRFLKTCVNMKDEFYNRYLVKNSLLEPVLSAYLKYNSKENMLHSAFLDFFDIVRKENMKGLLAAIVESNLWPQLESITKDKNFLLSVKSRYEVNMDARQNESGQENGGHDHGEGCLEQQREAAAAQAMRIRGEKEEDTIEENYFREEDDEQPQEDASGTVIGQVVLEASPPLPGAPHRLVDYDDDDDTIPLNGKCRIYYRRIYALKCFDMCLWMHLIALLLLQHCQNQQRENLLEAPGRSKF